ncbi:response regulator [Aliiroseovarius subalbicans]|uniref:response regulator n=1 Tax=Aliiroseovarius subalbicans TaxID=2925840 RepID=UPI001F586AC0|nr:response regulator [Aliiroseovarius subalbicans]MCI2399764.1 response regulator [Aliiroseovarius subalbicans]
MRVLIVENNPDLGKVWAAHILRQGAEVSVERCEEDAIGHLAQNGADVIILNLDLERGSALAVADYAAYRHPEARVIFVTSSSFFSDGSIFAHAANACACLHAQTAPEDMAALVEYHGRGASAAE